VILSLVAAVATMIVRGFARDTTRIVTAREVRMQHERWLEAAATAPAIPRADEGRPANYGLALHEADGVVP
jgi:cytochrome o ubiquinol oxidase subunit 1